MRIGIDARMLGPGFGLARYVQQLVHHLQMLPTEHEFVLFLKKDNWDRYTPSSNRVRKVLADIPWYSVKEQVEFPARIREERVDLMHFPHWNVPLFYNDPFVVTIHDLTMFHYPRPEATTRGPVVFWMKDQAHRRVLRHAARVAKHIAVTSEWTKQDISTHLQVPLSHMTVTYQAPFEPTSAGAGEIESVRSRFGLKKPYVLYVGAAYPHKNLERLLAAWKQCEDVFGDMYELVLVGKPDYFYERLRNSDAFHACKQARYLGFVEDNDLSLLYGGASLFVYPSLYEGFGLPPLEAMAHGVPVVSSSASCMPEVLGEGALFVDPQNIDHMAQGIIRGLTDESVRYDLRQNAQQELRRYRWDTLAKQTLDIYTRAHRNP